MYRSGEVNHSPADIVGPYVIVTGNRRQFKPGSAPDVGETPD